MLRRVYVTEHGGSWKWRRTWTRCVSLPFPFFVSLCRDCYRMVFRKGVASDWAFSASQPTQPHKLKKVQSESVSLRYSPKSLAGCLSSCLPTPTHTHRRTLLPFVSRDTKAFISSSCLEPEKTIKSKGKTHDDSLFE